jgi:threonine/homoserine/homoserine lactone efflux protein
VERPVFARGLVIGFSIAAPVGPIGVLCIRRTLADGRTTGLAVGLGAAAADAVYGAIAGFGLTAISTPLVHQQGALRMIGGLFLRYLGVRTFLARPADNAARASGAGLFGAFAATFGLTLTNPATILSFVAVFAGLGIAGAGGWREATVLVGGVFLGSVLWWLMLTGTVGAMRARLDPAALRWINRLSGLVLSVFGGGGVCLAMTPIVGRSGG